ncbi:unnamed protein product [Orchesella dallaii]|uniref:Odorant receptor n=1 Tax=Orchesella dallaii TaxID=48710 RepID=A0ABP1PLA5_9HEXA
MAHIAMCSHFDWDSEKEEFRHANNYANWNALFLLVFHIYYPIAMTMYLIAKPFSEEGIGSGIQMASYVVGWAEVVTISFLLAVQHRVLKYQRHITFLTNQMFEYSKHIENLLFQRNLQLNKSLMRVIHIGECVMLFAGFVTIFISIAFAGCLCIKFEPTHVFFQEVFEVNLKIPQHLPFISFAVWTILNSANAAYICIMLAITYFQLSKVCLSALKPVAVQRQVIAVRSTNTNTLSRIEYRVMTRNFGVIKDTSLIEMYRTQQLFNKLLNQFFASLIVSFHHVACLSVFVFVSLLVLKYTDAIFQAGVPAIGVTLVAVFASALIEWFESMISGSIYDASEEVVKKSRIMTNRKSYFHKVVLSCPNLAYELAKPFFHVDKHTFPQFIHHGLDFLISLLMI